MENQHGEVSKTCPTQVSCSFKEPMQHQLQEVTSKLKTVTKEEIK